LSTNYNKFNSRISDEKIFLKMMKKINYFIKKNNIINVIIQKHPSEDKKKYETIHRFLDQDFNFNVKISEKDLIPTLVNSKFAIGVNSMGLVVAKLLGCKTINYLIRNSLNAIPKEYIDISIV